MNSEAFLALVAGRLSRTRASAPSPRALVGVPPFHAEVQATTPEAAIADFSSALAAVGGEVQIVSSRAELAGSLLELARSAAGAPCVSWARREFAGLELEELWLAGAMSPSDALDPAAYRELAARAALGLTTVDAAITATGTLMLRAGPTRPRSTSLLPTQHVAIVRRDQLVARLGLAMGRALALDRVSQILFVTGPSRTSDIENDLTIGVHGPAAVTVLILDSD